MLVYRSLAAAAVCGGWLLVGCADPDLPTDLRKDGPPHVTSVVVMSDLTSDFDPGVSLSRLVETATYCRPNDDKRPGLVGLPDFTTTQVCPDELNMGAETDGSAEGAPPVWFVRVVFDELLNPNVEELGPDPDDPNLTIGSIKNTKPVSLKCGGVDVPYDGYYAPNGNKVSWPLGPNIFIQPDDPESVKTGESCEVSVLSPVKNKGGTAIADKTTFNFTIAPLAYRFSVPS